MDTAHPHIGIPDLAPPPDVDGRALVSPQPDLLLDAPAGELGTLLFYPDKGLEKPCEPVEEYDEELAKLVSDLAYTMYSLGGVGLAAPQIGILRRVFIVDVFATRTVDPSYYTVPDRFRPPPPSEPLSQLLVAINPEIMKVSEETELEVEGCLSFPGCSSKVQRASVVWVKGYDRAGKPWALKAAGFLGRAIQHELDHLDGVTFIDRMTPNRRRQAIEKAEKFRGKVLADAARAVAPPRPSAATRAKARSKRKARKGRRK